MINIIQANYLEARIIRLIFSDGFYGDYNLQPLIDRA